MVEVKKKKSESFESLVRKFNRRIQQSGKVLQAKKIRYKEQPVNKNKRKKLTTRRLEINSKKEYLKKTGKIKED